MKNRASCTSSITAYITPELANRMIEANVSYGQQIEAAFAGRRRLRRAVRIYKAILPNAATFSELLLELRKLDPQCLKTRGAVESMRRVVAEIEAYRKAGTAKAARRIVPEWCTATTKHGKNTYECSRLADHVGHHMAYDQHDIVSGALLWTWKGAK